MPDLPPPPRGAPAAASVPRSPGGSGFAGPHSPHGHGLPSSNSFIENMPPPRSAPSAQGLPGSQAFHLGNPGGRAGGGGGGGGGGQFQLKVLTNDNQWQSVAFSAGDNLDQRASAFLQQTGLKGAFQAGLAQKMRAMASGGQAQCSVDIVDLI
eukprot:gnl/TRDRNA2_/TRDRNA2_167665_c0_seq1.p2 gnl/TRDRNA2_/TRDRNA2_167665_c0~~gnl/TRDRNA2_/TRDRNA2_167665_c0_seq1.p2  ORF type:complete len:161 (+),score=28.18 gnl/TRDRNA2_/TRDRNA2_167665_c0_seq1:27-485(+)